MYWVWMLIVSLIAGIIFGPLARLVLPGKQNISLGWTILGGGIGAFIGGLIAYFLGVKDTSGPDWIQYLIQIICAAIVIDHLVAQQQSQNRLAQAPPNGRRSHQKAGGRCRLQPAHPPQFAWQTHQFAW